MAATCSSYSVLFYTVNRDPFLLELVIVFLDVVKLVNLRIYAYNISVCVEILHFLSGSRTHALHIGLV
jgi:hypothetical protein